MKFLNIYSRYMYYNLFYFIHYAHLKKMEQMRLFTYNKYKIIPESLMHF